MDNIFRIKKSRDPTKKREVQGTLDSIHQNLVTSMKDVTINLDELRKREIEIEEHLETVTDYTATKLQEELQIIRKRLAQDDPLKDYYLKNADVFLKYYGGSDKVQNVSVTPADQNTFVKYLMANAPQETPTISKKDLYDEFTTRMKLNTGIEEKVKDTTEHCER